MGNCGRKKAPQQNSTILSEEEIRLLLQNTKLDRKEINDLHASFLHQCPTGRMTKKDFLKFFKEVHPAQNKREKAEKFCDYVFKVIDRKNKGYISFEDFVLCLSLTSHGDFREKCEFAFKLYDLDKDNKITKSEMTKVLTALYDLSGITDRKGNNAPAKKVDTIINQINQKNAPTQIGKKAKPVNYITRDQFIDACCNDNYIKNLFMDPIFVFHDSSKPVIQKPLPSPKPQPIPSPAVQRPIVDIPTIYIESRPDNHVVYNPAADIPVVYNPPAASVNYSPQIIRNDKQLALYLDEKETFDFVDRYIAEINNSRTPASYSQNVVVEAPRYDYFETKGSHPHLETLNDYVLNDHPQYEMRYSGLNRSAEDLARQEIKHLI